MLRLQRFSFRFAEQVPNSNLALKQEIERILTDQSIDLSSFSRPNFNEVLEKKFVSKGWTGQLSGYYESKDPSAKIDFFKDRVGV